MSLFIESFAGIKSSLLFKKDSFVVLGTMYTAILIYFISADCSSFFLSHAFLEPLFLLQLVIWSAFIISTKNDRCQNIWFHGTTGYVTLSFLWLSTKKVKKNKILYVLGKNISN